ncbi:unnamed protein product [Vicia faba]|uniref:Uncharacterized protein n=1 Tax=Vicia faba TaxID=3906 RepID=A0AAV1AUI0_VICFA|nr:unnamed protein product [Vicia faba]
MYSFRQRSRLSESGVTYQRVWLGLAFFFVEQLSNSSSLPIFTPASDLFKVSKDQDREELLFEGAVEVYAGKAKAHNLYLCTVRKLLAGGRSTVREGEVVFLSSRHTVRLKAGEKEELLSIVFPTRLTCDQPTKGCEVGPGTKNESISVYGTEVAGRRPLNCSSAIQWWLVPIRQGYNAWSKVQYSR